MADQSAERQPRHLRLVLDNPSVLLVDDDIGTIETLGFCLRAERFHVATAGSAAAAIYRAQQRTPDVVVCDLHLPDGSGLDVLRTLRQMGVAAAFIIITGFGDVVSALEAGRMGVRAYVEKPIDASRLVALVHAQTDALKKPESVDTTPSLAARIQQVVKQRYAEPDLSTHAVARAVGVSVPHLCRVIKHQLGMTFTDLLRDIRLQAASQLLAEDSCSIKEIAFRVGFRHPSQFTRAFRTRRGVSPSEFRTAIE